MAKVHRFSVYRPKRSVPFLKNEFYEEISNGIDNYGSLLGLESRVNISVSSITGNNNCSKNVVDYLQRREHGAHGVRPITFKKEYGTRHVIMYNLLHEYEIPLHTYNKVFCAKWLSDSQIILGTKCNKMLILDLYTKRYTEIPNLRSKPTKIPPEQTYGIYSIQMNPSHTLLATSGKNTNDVAIYHLPTFEPVCVGEEAHKDRIFDIAWLDDQFLVSGSRDGSIALWRVNEDLLNASQHKDTPGVHFSIKPTFSKPCEKADKVRALKYNPRYQECVALSLNSYLHAWDLNTLKQKMSISLPEYLEETVCMASTADCSMYAVGSKSYLTLHDSRSLKLINKVGTRPPSSSIRSLSFENTLVTVGLGNGLVMFYDCRIKKYMDFEIQTSWTPERFQPVTLKASNGWVLRDEVFRQMFERHYSPAILTHCYDPSGTRLFTAGGPLPSSLYGNYAAVWQ